MARGRGEEDDEPASPGARLLQTPGFDLCILAVLAYKTSIDVDLFKNEVGRTLARHPRFSSLFILNNKRRGTFSWKRTKVDLEKHIIVPDLDPDMENPNEFIDDYISGLSKNRLTHEKPLWEVHVLNVKNSDAHSRVVFKIDHSIGDGVSLISIVLSCAKKSTSNPNEAETKKRKTSAKKTGLAKRLLSLVWMLMVVLFNTLTDSIMNLSTILFLKDTKTLIKAEPGVELSPKRYAHRIISFDDVKFVKNSMNVSINDVALGITESGLARYLHTIYGATTTLPKNLRIRSACMFNLRPPLKPEEIAEMMEKEKVIKGLWGNIVGVIVLPLEVALEADPLNYLRRAKANMDRKKLSLGHKLGFTAMKLLMFLFGSKIAAVLMTQILRNTTLTFSNVVGPKEEISVFGHPLAYIAPSVFGYPQALVVHYQSYADKFVIVIGADEKSIPNPGQLCDDIVNSFQTIREAVLMKNGGPLKAPEIC